jgi:Flp pilus assembly pilin Flp
MNYREQRGASLVEYALLVALIAVIGLAGVRIVGENARDTFDRFNEQGLVTAGTDIPPCTPMDPC